MSYVVLLLTLVCMLPADDVTDLEEKVLQSRLAILSGHVKAEFIEFQLVEDEFVEDRIMVYDMWFDSGKLRTDVLTGRRSKESGECVPFAKDEGLRVDGKLYYNSAALDTSGEVIHVGVAFEHAEYWDSYQKYVVDPRLMGLEPVSFNLLHSCAARDFVANPIRITTNHSDTLLNGDSVSTVSYEKEGASAAMWVVPEKGWNLAKSEILMKDGLKFSLETTLEKTGSLWFPKVMTFSVSDSTGKVIERTRTSVLAAELNEEVPSGKFTPADLTLKDGAYFFPAHDPGRPFEQLSGGRVLAVKYSEEESPDARPQEPFFRRTIFLTNLLVGLAILAYMAFRKLRKSS